jgi:serpin B
MVTNSAVMEKPKPIEVRVDRPFLFAIQHRASGACLFLGRVTDPR